MNLNFEYNVENIRNIGTAAHIDHGKTTFSDSILALAGYVSEELAGKKLIMDTEKQEQERGITIRAAYSSNIFQKEKKKIFNKFNRYSRTCRFWRRCN